MCAHPVHGVQCGKKYGGIHLVSMLMFSIFIHREVPIKYQALPVNSSTWKKYFINLFDTSFFDIVVVVFVFILHSLKHLMVFEMHFNGFGKCSLAHTHSLKWNAYSKLGFKRRFYISQLSGKHNFLPEITSMEIIEMQH